MDWIFSLATLLIAVLYSPASFRPFHGRMSRPCSAWVWGTNQQPYPPRPEDGEPRGVSVIAGSSCLRRLPMVRGLRDRGSSLNLPSAGADGVLKLRIDDLDAVDGSQASALALEFGTAPDNHASPFRGGQLECCQHARSCLPVMHGDSCSPIDKRHLVYATMSCGRVDHPLANLPSLEIPDIAFGPLARSARRRGSAGSKNGTCVRRLCQRKTSCESSTQIT